MTTLHIELLTGRVDIYVGQNPHLAAITSSVPGVERVPKPSRQYNYIGRYPQVPPP